MSEDKEFSSFFCQFKLWKENPNPIWLASTVRLFRNIEKFKFPIKLDDDRRRQIVALVNKELIGIEKPKTTSFFKAEDLSGLEKEYLVEHFLSNESFHSTGIGEAFMLDETGNLLLTLNMRNHLHFQVIETMGEIEGAWSELTKFETNLGKAMGYSFSQKFGFLTADPAQCGTALQATVFMQLSGLIHMDKIDGILEKLVDESLTVTGIQGSPTEIIGDIVVFQNNYTLGVTEDNILSNVRSMGTKLLVEEHAMRTEIRNKDHPEIKDKVSRAFGILIHSYQITTVEALNAISLLKLGTDLGWVTGVDMKQLNALFFNCRRAHLLFHYHDKILQEDIQHKRAEFIHHALKEAKLTI